MIDINNINNLIEILLQHNFKITKRDEKINLKKKSINLYINNEDLKINIWGESKSYSYWHLNEFPSKKEIKNLIFFSYLNYTDQNYLYSKIQKQNLGKILEIDQVFVKLKGDFFLMKKNEIEAINKRIKLYESFVNSFNFI